MIEAWKSPVCSLRNTFAENRLFNVQARKRTTRFSATMGDLRNPTVGLTKQQAIEMLESDDLVGLGMEAHQMRLQKNDPRVVTYQIDRNINYTNF